jgi:hypothetical protein
MNGFWLTYSDSAGHRGQPARHETLAAAQADAQAVLGASEKWREVRIWRKRQDAAGWEVVDEVRR